MLPPALCPLSFASRVPPIIPSLRPQAGRRRWFARTPPKPGPGREQRPCPAGHRRSRRQRRAWTPHHVLGAEADLYCRSQQVLRRSLPAAPDPPPSRATSGRSRNQASAKPRAASPGDGRDAELPGGPKCRRTGIAIPGIPRTAPAKSMSDLPPSGWHLGSSKMGEPRRPRHRACTLTDSRAAITQGSHVPVRLCRVSGCRAASMARP